MDPQDEVNKRRSKALHASIARQTFAKEGAIDDINTFKKEAQKPDGHLEFPHSGTFGQDFGIVPNNGLDVAQFNLYQDSKDFIQTVRQSEALEGKASNLSGKAINSLQQGGLTEQAPIRDTHAHWKKAVYRAVWNRIKQFWREEKWIRVTDEDKNLRFVGLNQEATQGEKMLSDHTGESVQDIRQKFGPKLEEAYQMRPELREPAKMNDVAEMDVDIIVEEVPDTVNMQAEEFEKLVRMYEVNPGGANNPQGIPWESVIEMSTLRNKDKILNKDQTPEEQEAAAQQQAIADEAMKIEKDSAVADIQTKRAKMAKDLADAEGQKITNQLLLQGKVEATSRANS